MKQKIKIVFLFEAITEPADGLAYPDNMLAGFEGL